MPNTKDLDIKNIKLKVLCYGGSGTGKTTFASTFPKPYFFDFDGGVLSLRGRDVEYDTYTDVYKGKERVKSAWKDFQAKKDDLDKYETIVIDSITTLEDYAMTELLELNKRTEPTLHEWGRLVSWMRNFLAVINGYDKHVVVIAHEEMLKDEITGEVWIRPLVVGKKLPQEMPLFFDEVYRSVATKSRQPDADVSYNILTKASEKYICKSRLGVLKDVEVADYKSIMNKIKGGDKK